MRNMLYVVATPIGNMEDISYRAVRVLSEVDLIAAEDTRRTGKLLAFYGIDTQMCSYHAHSARGKTRKLLHELRQGRTVGLVSDSGTPGISDPGERLIREAIKEGFEITHIPGPSALITALVLSGKPTSSFVFEGFLSNKRARRKKSLKILAEERRTVVLYESPHRILAFLEDLLDVAGDRDIAVARELTKKFEEVRRGKVSEHIEHFSSRGVKGELVVIM